ncbi:MAG TPA: M48 family metallopeptidase [Steroidobacteraceae bacterium]|nr:M48 family metallopeptidase [Steroidobacteraceae bacterium]
MDFYAYQAVARRQSRVFVLMFMAAVAVVVIALDAVIFTVLAARSAVSPAYGEQFANASVSPLEFAMHNPGAVFVVSLLIIGVIGLASLFKSAQLRGGGAVVAQSLGGVRVERDSTDPARQRLRNIIEEMSIASGVPVPEIYVLEQEPAINAFAAGHTPANACITVTQGAIDHLSRDELQGVIGHEFSHILNGDMRLNIQLMGAIFGLLVIAIIGRLVFNFAPRGGGDRDRRGGSLGWVGVGLAAMVLGYLGLLAGRMLQAAVSRQRERLADASAVQFTRNTSGLKGALMKIAALEEGSKFVAADAEQVAHMLFAPGLDRIFATHPPLLERIRELDPHFDPSELQALIARGVPSADSPATSSAPAPTPGPAAAMAGASGFAADAGSIAAQVGRPQPANVAQAQVMREQIPPVLRNFSDTGAHARSMVLALLVSRDPAIRAAQAQRIAQEYGAAELNVVNSAIMAAGTIAPMLRLPALLQLFPTLRRLPLAERQRLNAQVSDLIHLDSNIDVFEFCLAKLLETMLNDAAGNAPPYGSLSLENAVEPVHIIFCTLARCGSDAEAEIRTAYAAGISGVLSRYPDYATYDDWPQRTSAALGALDQLQLPAKQKLIEGLVRTVASDGRLKVEEAELLRTACALLHCPMPILH